MSEDRQVKRTIQLQQSIDGAAERGIRGAARTEDSDGRGRLFVDTTTTTLSLLSSWSTTRDDWIDVG